MGFSSLWGKSLVLNTAILLIISCSRARMQSFGVGALGAAAQLSLLVKSPSHCLHSWAFLWGAREARWLLPLIAKPLLVAGYLQTPKPQESTQKGSFPVQALVRKGKASSGGFLGVLVWKCPHGEVNHSAEGLFTLPWVVMALLHCLSSHAPASFTKLSMPR